VWSSFSGEYGIERAVHQVFFVLYILQSLLEFEELENRWRSHTPGLADDEFEQPSRGGRSLIPRRSSVRCRSNNASSSAAKKTYNFSYPYRSRPQSTWLNASGETPLNASQPSYETCDKSKYSVTGSDGSVNLSEGPKRKSEESDGAQNEDVDAVSHQRVRWSNGNSKAASS
jgi:hypothetical protein